MGVSRSEAVSTHWALGSGPQASCPQPGPNTGSWAAAWLHQSARTLVMSQMFAQHSCGGRAKGTPQARAQPGAPRKACGPSGSRAGGAALRSPPALESHGPSPSSPRGRLHREHRRVTAGIPACSAQCRSGRSSGLARRFPQLTETGSCPAAQLRRGGGDAESHTTVRKAKTLSVTDAATGQATRGDWTPQPHCLVSFVCFTCWASLATELHVSGPPAPAANDNPLMTK